MFRLVELDMGLGEGVLWREYSGEENEMVADYVLKKLASLFSSRLYDLVPPL